MKKLLIALLLIMMTLQVSAQTADWQAVIYDESANLLHVIDASGVQESITIPLMSTGEIFVPYQVSSDLQFAVGVVQYDEPPEFAPAIANIGEGVCCRLINIPKRQTEPFYIRFTNFLEDTSRFVLSINTFDFDNPEGSPGWMAFIDAASGEIINSIVLTEYYAYVTTLEEDGVRFLEAPFAATEWAPYDYYNIWNPQTNVLMTDTDEFAPGFRGELLPTTGEAVMGVYDEAFPIPYAEYMIPPGNTVRYFEKITDDIPDFFSQPEGGTTVYFDADHMETSPRWVMDGNAFLVFSQFLGDTDNIDLVQRDRNAMTIPAPGMTFLGGTTDGWLMVDEERGILYHFTGSGSSVAFNELARFRADIQLLRMTPELGASATGEFLPYTLPEVAFSPLTAPCPGLLPPRLQPGGKGWVLPGPANNFRVDASVDAELIGQLQGSVVFEVISGPVCADNLTWWQVSTSYGEIGWTAEGNSSEYWTAPLP